MSKGEKKSTVGSRSTGTWSSHVNIGSETSPVSNDKTDSRQRRCSLLCLTMLVPLFLLASCTPKAVKIQPPVSVPKTFSSNGQAVLPQKWWIAFDDIQLNSLIDQTLRDNFSLRTAWDRLDQARAVAAKSGSPLWPSIDGSADASQTMVKSDGSGWDSSSQFSLGIVASYEVDLWGRVRSTYDASQLDVVATAQDLHAAAITLTAEVARTWYLLVEQHGQLKLLDEQIKTNEKYLEIITLKFRRGQVSATDVLQQRQLIESTKGEQIQVESNIRVLEHGLDVLLGRNPGSLAVAVPAKLSELPPLPQTGLPAEWIRHRPDVRSAELRVQAADRRVATAIADQFPKLSLSVRAETSAEQIRDVFDNWLANLAANLVAPLFDAGLRRAEVERTRAVVSEQLNSYGQIVLTSLQEVEDALTQEAKQKEYLASLREQLDLSRQSTEQTRENYTRGTMDFTRYLTTLLGYQRLQRTYLQAQRELVEFRINLYRALGGSWELSAPTRRKMEPSAVWRPDR